jgi:pyruvate/2-oxoglutarate dehydrogenase complex dihydrolipoamide acyltransferase (E2) component
LSVSITVPSAGDPALTAEIQVARWHFSAGQEVGRGDLLVTLESKLLVLELEAEASGKLEILAPQGKFLEVGETVALVHST